MGFGKKKFFFFWQAIPRLAGWFSSEKGEFGKSFRGENRGFWRRGNSFSGISVFFSLDFFYFPFFFIPQSERKRGRDFFFLCTSVLAEGALLRFKRERIFMRLKKGEKGNTLFSTVKRQIFIFFWIFDWVCSG